MVDRGLNLNLARSFSLISLIVGNVFLVLVNSSNTRYVVQMFKETHNKARLSINSIALLMVFSIVYVPWLQPLFKTKALNGRMLLLACLIGVLSTGWWEGVKFIRDKVY
jgi:Ca2+-transporting ATPase